MKNPFKKSKVLVGTMLAAALFAGCGDSENFVFTNTNTNNTPIIPVPPALQAPVAVNDSFPALGNATLIQAATGVLANDTLNSATITSFDAVGDNGGTIDINADGSFTYTPAVDFKGSESFAYTISNATGDSTATVTLTSTGFGRFVDNSGANGSGTQASPFNNLADAAAAAQSGDTIYVARGNGTNLNMTGGVLLKPGVDLVGEGTGLILSQTIEPAGTAGPITCQGDNIIQGVTVDGSADELILISSTTQDVTVTECTLLNPTNEHLDIDNAAGTVVISNNMFDNPPDDNTMDYIRFNNFDTDANISITGNTFRNTGQNSSNVDDLVEIGAAGTSAFNLTFSDNIANGTAADEFNFGLTFTNTGTGDCTATVDGNEFSRFAQDPISLLASSTGAITGSVTGNTLDLISSEGITSSLGGGTMTISGNMISNTIFPIYVYTQAVNGVAIISNNNITDTAGFGILILDGGDIDGKVALRSNVIIDSAASVSIIANDNSNICCDITDNEVDSDMEFSVVNPGTITVERFGNPMTGDELQSAAVNTFINPAMVQVLGLPVTDAEAGDCEIP